MDVEEIKAQLRQQHPESRIVENAPDGTRITELVREDADTANAVSSSAMAVIERSPRHHHDQMTEVYRLVRGTLTLFVDQETHQLAAGDEFRIDPGRTHWAESDPADPAWVEVICTPPFTPADYFLDL